MNVLWTILPEHQNLIRSLPIPVAFHEKGKDLPSNPNPKGINDLNLYANSAPRARLLIVGHLWVARGLFVELCFHNLSYPPSPRLIAEPSTYRLPRLGIAKPPFQRGLANRASLSGLPLDRTPDCI